MHDTTLENIFLEAIEKFPYPNIQPTGYTQGNFESSNFDTIEYSEEFTFDAGTVCDIPIGGGGWIVCLKQDESISITGLFALARESDWQKGCILREGEYLQSWYDLEKKTWSFYIDMI